MKRLQQWVHSSNLGSQNCLNSLPQVPDLFSVWERYWACLHLIICDNWWSNLLQRERVWRCSSWNKKANVILKLAKNHHHFWCRWEIIYPSMSSAQRQKHSRWLLKHRLPRIVSKGKPCVVREIFAYECNFESVLSNIRSGSKSLGPFKRRRQEGLLVCCKPHSSDDRHWLFTALTDRHWLFTALTDRHWMFTALTTGKKTTGTECWQALTGTDCSQLWLTGTDCSQLWLTGTECSQLWLTGTDCPQLWLTGTDCSQLWLTGTYCSQLWLTGTDCSQLWLTDTKCSQLWRQAKITTGTECWGTYLGLARTVYLHRIWPYVPYIPINIWFWPTLHIPDDLHAIGKQRRNFYWHPDMQAQVLLTSTVHDTMIRPPRYSEDTAGHTTRAICPGCLYKPITLYLNVAAVDKVERRAETLKLPEAATDSLAHTYNFVQGAEMIITPSAQRKLGRS